MLKKTNERGITLISLVITIIILLILATVAINLAVDSDGLFGKAGQAANSWNTSVAEENEKLGNLLGTIEEMTREKTLVELYDAGQLKIGDYVAYNPIAAGETGEEAKYTYTSTDEMTGLAEEAEVGIASINIVKTTEPEVEVNADQTFKVDANTKWRVLGVEGEGSTRHILLISEEPIKNTAGNSDYYLYGAQGYEYGPTELNNISAIYGHGTGATGAVSVNADHVNKITGVTEENLATYDQLGVYGRNYSFDMQKTPKIYLDGEEATTLTGQCTAYEYLGNTEGLQTNTVTNPENGAILYNMLFTDNYWLATQGEYVNRNLTTAKIENEKEVGILPVATYFTERVEYKLGYISNSGKLSFGAGNPLNVIDGRYVSLLFSSDYAVNNSVGSAINVQPVTLFVQKVIGKGYSGIRPVVSLKPEATITMVK